MKCSISMASSRKYSVRVCVCVCVCVEGWVWGVWEGDWGGWAG